jgi:hypothetical protein
VDEQAVQTETIGGAEVPAPGLSQEVPGDRSPQIAEKCRAAVAQLTEAFEERAAATQDAAEHAAIQELLRAARALV